MKGYQRADKPHEAGSLADVLRKDANTQSRMHLEQPDHESSYCVQGRKSYLLTRDKTLVTCKACRKLARLDE